MKKLRILRTKVTNPWFNLATENWIFRDLDPDTFTLYLWRNDNTVVIGNYQNPWVECKVDKMEADQVFLARRQSGGGAVFHDLGNTNFTFLSSRENYKEKDNFQIIIDALKSLGVEAEHSGRNDLLVDERKISGSAFRHTPDRSFHHGTLLINANMARLADYLNPNPLKLEAKGVKSVRSRVANLAEFNKQIEHEVMCQAIIKSFCDYHGESVEVEWLDEDNLRQIESLNQYYQQFSDWDWRFGKTPEFSHKMETRFEWGIITLHLLVDRAVVTEATVFSDALNTGLIEVVQANLPSAKYNVADMRSHFDKIIAEHSDYTSQLNEICDWICEQINKEE